MPLKFQTSDRHYQEWSIVDTLTMQKTECSVDPIREKLFNQDIFSLNEKCTILHSMVRQMKCIQGVLVLENNKTYGKWKRDKFIYQCIPDDRRLPVFLIPYKVKLSFGKKVLNKYNKFVNYELLIDPGCELHFVCNIVQDGLHFISHFASR